MTLEIGEIWTPSADEWDQAWHDCPYSTYFQSREWAEIWADFTDGKTAPHPVGVTFSDGTRIILPFSKEKILKGLSARYVSSPAGTFGGWLADAALPVEKQTLLLQLIIRRYRNLTWRINPYEPITDITSRHLMRDDETHALDLFPGFENIHRSWSKGHASAVRKARKAGVEISIAASESEWAEYYHVYQDSLRRWGDAATSIYPLRLFETIMRRDSPNVRLWLARHQGLLIAGALCFYSPVHVVYWHGAALSAHFDLRPVNFLMYEAIKDAAERGGHWFDFNPSGGLDGVKAFKSSFGAQAIRSDVISRSSLLVNTVAALRTIFERKRHD